MKVKPRDKFDAKKLLPTNDRIESIDSHLYRIGLSLFPIENCQRSRFSNPKLIFITELQLLGCRKIETFSIYLKLL